jgi:hypothetical protein
LDRLIVIASGRLPESGFHGDEMYYVFAGQHPAFGYVDQPPLAPLLAVEMARIVPGQGQAASDAANGLALPPAVQISEWRP